MEPNEKIYGVHWEVDSPHALWQLTSQNYLRVDVTRQFNSKYRLIAYRELLDDEGASLRALAKDGAFESQSCGQDGLKGYDTDIFFHTAEVGSGYGWRVTNCARILPGLRHEWTRPANMGNSLADMFGKSPHDNYVVQFNAVPWDVFKRYWRKPINLDRKFHGKRRKTRWGALHSIASGVPAIEVLDFDLTLLKSYKCFFADFSFMWAMRTRTSNVDMALWMLSNVKGFSLLTDEPSPFNRADDELLFTLEWM